MLDAQNERVVFVSCPEAEKWRNLSANRPQPKRCATLAKDWRYAIKEDLIYGAEQLNTLAMCIQRQSWWTSQDAFYFECVDTSHAA